ncbi:MAG TPA: tryptophan-rich sensory protein [Patescibacteria group bacterium]|nr:tryptophan-rich sensory protein [Patescibacteria group bacterium]
MKTKTHYWAVPLAVIAVAVLGSLATNVGMSWYYSLNTPDLTPPGSFIGTMWTIIFTLSTIALILFYNSKTLSKDKNKALYSDAFITNAVLNVLWSVLFFGLNSPFMGLVCILLLEASNIWIEVILWKKNKIAFALWLVYTAWVLVATYFNFMIWILNK